jgi:pyrroline-5-carboxylate reductase
MSSNIGLRIGFIGAGKMATALARGFLAAGLIKPDQLMACDVIEGARAAFNRETGGAVSVSIVEVIQFSEILFIAVKPQQVNEVLGAIKVAQNWGGLIVSIAAGVSLSRLENGLFPNARIIRVMPNTPALVGAAATGYALGHSATAEDGALAQKLFGAVGVAFSVKETLLDAVTGLSGSGPAYGFLMIEALSDGGVAAGLPRDIATRLAAQTLLGSARMVLETGMHPGALKDMVTSPAGTTIEGIHELEKGGLRATLMSAVRAASEKSKKLGGG